jgi:hypothetical protein
MKRFRLFQKFVKQFGRYQRSESKKRSTLNIILGR